MTQFSFFFFFVSWPVKKKSLIDTFRNSLVSQFGLPHDLLPSRSLPCSLLYNCAQIILLSSTNNFSFADQTHDIVKRANDVSVTGAIKAFDEEFRLMQKNIDEITSILSGINFTHVDIKDIQNLLEVVR